MKILSVLGALAATQLNKKTAAIAAVFNQTKLSLIKL